MVVIFSNFQWVIELCLLASSKAYAKNPINCPISIFLNVRAAVHIKWYRAPFGGYFHPTFSISFQSDRTCPKSAIFQYSMRGFPKPLKSRNCDYDYGWIDGAPSYYKTPISLNVALGYSRKGSSGARL